MSERIFISYKRDNKDVVFKIKEDIEKNVGVKCWIDLDDIDCDAQFDDVIFKAIAKADVFLFMYSQKHGEITNWKDDWTIRELQYAEFKNKRIVFFNIDKSPLFDWVVALGYKNQQQVDAVSKLCENMKKWLKKCDKEVVYNVKVNCASWLYLDDEIIKQLKANKTVKILLSKEGDRNMVGTKESDSCLLGPEEEIGTFSPRIGLKSKQEEKEESSRSEKYTKEINNYSKKQYEYVDLGLSVKWARCNIGAEKSEDCGEYFAWGEVKRKKDYSLETYKIAIEKGVAKYKKKGNRMILDLEDDVANVMWKGKWRMPTKKDFDELIEKCKWEWGKQQGVKGYKVIGPNGNFIFLPAVGYVQGEVPSSVGSFANYWSSSFCAERSSAYCLSFGADFVDSYDTCRFYGRCVRAVCP